MQGGEPSDYDAAAASAAAAWRRKDWRKVLRDALSFEGSSMRTTQAALARDEARMLAGGGGGGGATE